MDILSIIYRNEIDIQNFKDIIINSLSVSNDISVIIYYLDKFEIKLNDKNNIKLINAGQLNVNEIKGIIYDKYQNTNNKLYILDSCVNYKFGSANNNNIKYTLLKKDEYLDIYIPYIYYYNFGSKLLSKDEFVNINFKNNYYCEDNSVSTIDNIFFKENLNQEGKLDNFLGEFISINETDYLKYSGLQNYDKYIFDICNFIENNVEDFKNHKIYDFIYLLCLLKINSPINTNQFYNSEPIINVMYIQKHTRIALINKIIDQHKTLEMPSWIKESDNCLSDDNYEEIVEYSKKKNYLLDESNIDISKELEELDEKYKDIIKDGRYNLLHLGNNKFLLTNQTWYKLDNSSLKYMLNLSIETSNFLGKVAKFMNYLLVLVKCTKSIYRLAIFNSIIDSEQFLSFIQYSKKFRIDDKDVKRLVSMNKDLYLELKDKKIQKISNKKLILEILNIDLDFNKNINFEIKDKNNFMLSFVNFNNDLLFKSIETLKSIKNEYKNFTFNLCDERPIAKIQFDFLYNLLTLNNKKFLISKFFYFPFQYKVPEKKHDVYFYNIPESDDFFLSCFKLGLDVGDNFETAKYIIIYQEVFEKLSPLIISEMIYHNCLIISLIDEYKIANNTFMKNYTSSACLNKLFLFNIAKNSEYINFIMEKIIYDEQYEKRKEFMSIDRDNLFKECNIFDIILEIKSYNENLTSNQSNIYKKILEKYKCGHLKSILNKIVSNEFCINFSVYEDSEIPDIFLKINFLGNFMKIKRNDNVTSDVLILSNIDQLKYVNILYESTIIYICDEKSEILNFSDVTE